MDITCLVEQRTATVAECTCTAELHGVCLAEKLLQPFEEATCEQHEQLNYSSARVIVTLLECALTTNAE